MDCSENSPTAATGTLELCFRITGPVCWLSHQETLTFWQRFLVRRGLPLIWRGGFNPRPRLSLPLPRTVGLQADEDLLTAEVNMAGGLRTEGLAEALNRQLPEGIEILSATLTPGRLHARPIRAVYRWSRRREFPADRWQSLWQRAQARIDSGEPIELRRTGPKGPARTIDLRAWLLALNGSEDIVEAACAIGPEGTLRIDEIMGWLGLGSADLAEPVRRISVEWNRN